MTRSVNVIYNNVYIAIYTISYSIVPLNCSLLHIAGYTYCYYKLYAYAVRLIEFFD